MKLRREWLLIVLIAGCSHKPPYEGRSVAELERMLDDPDPKVQVQGAFGLSQHGSEAASAVPALVRTLRSPDALVRQQAALALGQIGVADEAVPALAAALGDSEWTVRRQAAIALGQIGPPARAAEPDLHRCRRDPNTMVRREVEKALVKIGEATPSESR